MQETQLDFYKGIFLNQILAKNPQFNLNAVNQSEATISGTPLVEWYQQLNVLAEEFANEFVTPQP